MHIKEVHIGKLVEKVLREQNMSIKQFAKELGRDRSTVYDIFKRKNIDTDTLSRISGILGDNFFLEFHE
jgi:predicted transcriptional regulator